MKKQAKENGSIKTNQGIINEVGKKDAEELKRLRKENG